MPGPESSPRASMTPGRAARAVLKAALGASGRPSSAADGGAGDVERGAAAFEEEAFADGMPVVFQDLSYEVRHSSKRRQTIKLLDGVSGYLLPGQLSALMGPSGSGKTTLLNCLAGRVNQGVLSGTVRFSGHAASRTFLRRYTGYVEQADTLIANLSVFEMLLYSAELKLPVSTTRSTKVARVEAVLDCLALTPCRDVRIGSTLARGISGGQAKRVNIGLSLLSRPRVLFLDEPTSGLDSYSANECMAVIKALTRGGITVCATIHSPTPYAFDLFDRLHLLLRGRTAYFGDNGPAVVRFFQAVFPAAPPCEDGGGGGGGGAGGGPGGIWAAGSDLWDATDDAKKVAARSASSASLLVRATSGASALLAAGGGSGATPLSMSPAPSGGLPPLARAPSSAAAAAAACLAQPPPPPSAFHNRAEWVVDLTTRADRDGRAGECAAAYAASRLAAANAARVHRLLTERAPVSETVRAELAARHATTTPAWWGVRTMLAYRMARDYTDPDFLGPRIIDRALLSGIITILYWRVGADTSPGNAPNVTALLFLWSIMPGYASSACMPALVNERALFVREREDGLYRPITALIAKMVSELCIAAIVSVAAAVPVFFACKLSGSFAVFAGGFFVTTAVGVSLGHAIAASAPSMDVANAALPALVTMLLFFVGLLLRPQDMPRWLAWFKYCDFLHFSWSAQMLSQFSPDGSGGGAVSLDGVTSVLEFYSIPANGDPWVQLGYASLFFWVFSGLAWLALSYKTHQRR